MRETDAHDASRLIADGAITSLEWFETTHGAKFLSIGLLQLGMPPLSIRRRREANQLAIGAHADVAHTSATNVMTAHGAEEW